MSHYQEGEHRPMADKATLETVAYFFRVHGSSTKTCYEPQEKCQRTAIRAHSIPSSTVLSRLASGGHVVMPHMKLKFPPPAEISFRPVGRNNATTFTGLCDQHDNAIFRPIDESLPTIDDPEHLFLLAYRAVLREYHVVLQNAIRFQATYQKRVEVGLSPGDSPCDFGMFVTPHLANFFECYEYKRLYDNAYLQQHWQTLDHEILMLRDQQPSIAVSSMFSLDDIPAPETPRVTLSVFPIDNAVVVVFSSAQSDAPFVRHHRSQWTVEDLQGRRPRDVCGLGGRQAVAPVQRRRIRRSRPIGRPGRPGRECQVSRSHGTRRPRRPCRRGTRHRGRANR